MQQPKDMPDIWKVADEGCMTADSLFTSFKFPLSCLSLSVSWRLCRHFPRSFPRDHALDKEICLGWNVARKDLSGSEKQLPCSWATVQQFLDAFPAASIRILCVLLTRENCR